MKAWTARRLSNLSQGQAVIMVLVVTGLLCLSLGIASLLPLLRVSLMGLSVLDSAQDIAAFQESGLTGGAALVYTQAQKLRGYLVLTQDKASTMNVSLPYMYAEVPIGVDKEYTFLNLYRLSGADYEVLLVSKREPASPVSISMEYSDFYPEWKEAYLDGGANRYVFAASASPLPFVLFMLGVGMVLLLIFFLLHRLKPFWRATPFGKQLAKWGDPDDVERDLDAALAFPLFESGSMLLTDRWLILGERRHPQSAPILTKPDRILSARLVPDEDDETRLFLTFTDETEAEREWSCFLTSDEAARLKGIWPASPLQEETDRPAQP